MGESTGEARPTAVEQYAEGFRARVRASRHPGQDLVEAPGLVALLGLDADRPDGRVLVTDDRALDLLTDLLPRLAARLVLVLADAPACRERLSGVATYRSEPCTAMVCADLALVPVAPLPEGLALHPVDRGGDGRGVPLVEAAAAARRADPVATPASVPGFLAYLASVPDSHYLAAVDATGRVRATAGAATFGEWVSVYFVSTDPAWRGRGVATAMTAQALRTAADHGARRAFLDASGAGVSIYRRLGFATAATATVFADPR